MKTPIQTDWTLNQALLERAITLNTQLLELPICEENREKVRQHFQQIAHLAQLLNEFPLKDQTQPAPTFEP